MSLSIWTTLSESLHSHQSWINTCFSWLHSRFSILSMFCNCIMSLFGAYVLMIYIKLLEAFSLVLYSKSGFKFSEFVIFDSHYMFGLIHIWKTHMVHATCPY